MLPRAADESLHGHIVRGLRRREPGIDLVSVKEAGLRGKTAPEVLEWAANCVDAGILPARVISATMPGVSPRTLLHKEKHP